MARPDTPNTELIAEPSIDPKITNKITLFTVLNNLISEEKRLIKNMATVAHSTSPKPLSEPASKDSAILENELKLK